MRLEKLLLPAFVGFFLRQGLAQDPDKLTSGPGSTLTENRCKLCHELQHIRRTPLSRGEWSDNLKNMRERGTPMTDEELAVMLDYLSAYYSRDPAPPPAPDTLRATENDPVARLLQDRACIACHALDQRIVGPSFREIARRYAGDSGAPARLAAKVRAGGQGVWGPVPMPAAGAIPDPELATILDWVLGLK